eukprot:PLAT12718.1.p2 GENE.PLAT12718.1~~PLAT12718.1.p2  ORF type:complete len:177 (+),score=86.64 PLAT12718.1:106-636(+)
MPAVAAAACELLSSTLPLFFADGDDLDGALLSALPPHGAVLELQCSWAGEQHAALQRAAFLLQQQAAAAGWLQLLDGCWGGSLHLLLALADDVHTVDYLEGDVADALRASGCHDFRLPFGCSSPPMAVTAECTAQLPRGKRLLMEGEHAAVLRVFPAGSFAAVAASLSSFLHGEDV